MNIAAGYKPTVSVMDVLELGACWERLVGAGDAVDVGYGMGTGHAPPPLPAYCLR